MRDVRRLIASTLAVLLAGVILPLTAPASALADDDVGPDAVAPYILGGTTAAPGAWPGTVALAIDTGVALEQICGGTLVRADLVLTAAHCTRPFSTSDLRVLIGRSDLSLPGGELVAVAEVIEHPGWSEASWRHDIAIVRLATPTSHSPVSFADRTTEPHWASRPDGMLVGWGATNQQGTLPASQLKELAVQVLADEVCVGRVATYLVGGDLCVEAAEGGACPGDSGGPFMVASAEGPLLAGVISRGPTDPCGRGPGILTRVAAYADWVYQSTLSPFTTRTAGTDRYTTAVALSARFQPGVPVVYLVTGESFPDAVTAAAVAGANGGPVLLTARDELPSGTRAELARLRPGRLVVVGGRGAISDRVLGEAGEAAGVAPERLAGSDRYATAAALAADAHPSGVATVFLAVGTAFPDAVASGPVAGGPGGGPVLLTTSDRLPSPTREALTALAPTRVVLLGGTSAISAALQTELSSLLPGATTERISGSDRFATAAALSRSRFSPGVPVVYVATGSAFPDALASGPVAVSQGAPVLLVGGGRVPPVVAEEIRRLAPSRIEVLGGTSAVSQRVMWLVDGLR